MKTTNEIMDETIKQQKIERQQAEKEVKEENLEAIVGYFGNNAGLEKVVKLTWEEYLSSEQEIYLDNENCADYAVMRKYIDEDEIVTVTASAMKGYCKEDHVFEGGDDDYVIIDYPADGPSYLLYGGSWSDVDEYMKSEGFHVA